MLRKNLLLLLMLFVLSGFALVAQHIAVDANNSFDSSYLFEVEDASNDTEPNLNQPLLLAFFAFGFLLASLAGLEFSRVNAPVRQYSSVFYHAPPRAPPQKPLP